ncbi:virB8 family protein [Frateuria sp. GZRR35]|uniref:virB8 family protein n=1 Tax=unclassified Frateuria TaxID=2648894 RepID=UPI003EDC229C
MLARKTGSRKVEEAVAKAVNYELSIADVARRSERRAWWVAFCALGMSLILAGGYFYMLPLKQKVPYLVMADAYTGTSTVARLTEDLTHRRISTSEAINRSNVAHFVMARESYDLALLSLGDWTTVQTMASPGVKADYTRLYSPMNPDGPYKTYGKDKAIRVKLLSIVLIGGGTGRTPTGATVRFQRSLYDKQSGATQPLDSKIATMEFTYKANLEMDDRNRIENPLGFWVTSYRVDNDYATPAPVEVPSAANAQVVTRPAPTNSPAGSPPTQGQDSSPRLDGTPDVPATGVTR